MKPGIQIKNGKFKFQEFPENEIGLAKYCNSFQLELNDIRMIAISPRLAVDDETLFILVIDKDGKIFPIPDNVLKSIGIKTFEAHFQLKSIVEEWEKFDYNDHYGKYDKVIYPCEHYWKDLFKNDWKLKVRQFYSWANPKSFFGNLNKENVG
ncbi:MAG: hypothetical protein ACFB10_24805 [Salibacteraceae bacterium]